MVIHGCLVIRGDEEQDSVGGLDNARHVVPIVSQNMKILEKYVEGCKMAKHLTNSLLNAQEQRKNRT